MTRSVALTKRDERLSDYASPEALLNAVFDRCGLAVYRFVLVRLGGDEHLANDFMQQLWLQAAACDTSRRPEGPDELERWLWVIARNLVHEHWRKRASRPNHVPLPDADLAAQLSNWLTGPELPAEALSRQEVLDQLMLAVTELPSEEQELIVEHYLRGCPQQTLAQRLGVSTRAVEGRIYRARQALRQQLRSLDPNRDFEP
jgi:RNA polymerase sigma-70 factor (ECF subfamily)